MGEEGLAWVRKLLACGSKVPQEALLTSHPPLRGSLLMTLQSPGSSWPERCWLWGNILGEPNSSLLLVGPDFFHYFFPCFWILFLLQVWRCQGFPPPFFLLVAMLELKPRPPLHMPDSPSTSVSFTWNVPHRPLCLPTYSPAVGAILKNCISIGEWSLNEGSGHSLVTRFEVLQPSLPSCAHPFFALWAYYD